MVDQQLLGHAHREDRKASGATYTPEKLAQSVARRLLSFDTSIGAKSEKVWVLDPAVGDGALLHALISQIEVADRSNIHVVAFDIDRSALQTARRTLTQTYPEVSFDFRLSDFLDFAVECRQTGERFDLIIANPPYVRTQALRSVGKEKIRKHFGIGGRFDLAFPFILAMREMLATDGRAAVITSNRILSTQAAAQVRDRLISEARLLDIWDLGDSRLFDAAVLPCVVYFAQGQQGSDHGHIECGFSTIYETKECETAKFVNDICGEPLQPGLKKIVDGRHFDVRRGSLDATGGWHMSSQEDDVWMARLTNATWKSFDDVCKVSVGIKSTADKVFIAKEWATPRPELLRPLVTHHVAGRFRPSQTPQREVLYPYEEGSGRRTPVDLHEYPVSEAYLEHHLERLSGRAYVQASGREWFEIWVPHSPEDWVARKIVFRDIAERPTFWLETSGAVINGDCYWIKLLEDQDPDLIWLMLAVANSQLIERFYDTYFNERLYAGRRRFMTRHVRQFPLPDPEKPASIEAASIARRLTCDTALKEEYRSDLEDQLDMRVLEAFEMNE